MDPVERTTIEQRLVETGEKERLKEHLRNRLIESGWREELKLEAKKVNKERESGLFNLWPPCYRWWIRKGCPM